MISRIFSKLDINLDLREETNYSGDFFKDIVLDTVDEALHEIQ
jgi:hypothetical protein